MKVIDLGQISYLRMKGYKFDFSIDKVSGKVIFDFKNLNESDLKDYWNSEFYQYKLMIDSTRKIITNIKD